MGLTNRRRLVRETSKGDIVHARLGPYVGIVIGEHENAVFPVSRGVLIVGVDRVPRGSIGVILVRPLLDKSQAADQTRAVRDFLIKVAKRSRVIGSR